MTVSEEEFVSKFFPGSNTPLDIEEKRAKQQEESDQWDLKPMFFTVKGKKTEFFPIGALALALGGRKAGTIRAWEQEGIIPRPVFVKPSKDPRGRRRMYTRAMVEGLVKIAKEEGVFWPRREVRLTETQFPQRALELFQSLNRVG